MKRSFKDGIDDAKDLLDNSGKVKAQVYYDLNSFWASTCTFRPAKKGRAKCECYTISLVGACRGFNVTVF